jgi:hypothetical protein
MPPPTVTTQQQHPHLVSGSGDLNGRKWGGYGLTASRL